MAAPRLLAYIDEAGQRSRSPRSSDHFVMSAVVLREEDLTDAQDFLARLRSDLNRAPTDVLHWRNFKNHSYKVHATRVMGESTPWLTASSVVVCKRRLHASRDLTEDMAYLYTFRFLLERLSWMARDSARLLDYTLAHVVRFKLETLRHYESLLRRQASSLCKISWENVSAKGGRLDQPQRIPYLQLADIVASSTFAAFEPDEFGNTETRYLRELSPILYRRGSGVTALTSYGLKMHPWDDDTRAAYPWVAAL